MTYPYGMKNNPIIGKGLGGLPRRSEVSDGSILNKAVITTGDTTGDITIPFSIKDVRRVSIGFTSSDSDTGSAPTKCQNIFLGSYGETAYLNFDHSNVDYVVFTIQDKNTINISSQNGLNNSYIIVTEYNYDVISSETRSHTATATTQAITNKIRDPKKCIVSMWSTEQVNDESSATSVIVYEYSTTYRHLINEIASDSTQAVSLRIESDSLYSFVHRATGGDSSVNILQFR